MSHYVVFLWKFIFIVLVFMGGFQWEIRYVEFGKVEPCHLVDYRQFACQTSIELVEVYIGLMIESKSFVNGSEHIEQGYFRVWLDECV